MSDFEFICQGCDAIREGGSVIFLNGDNHPTLKNRIEAIALIRYLERAIEEGDLK